MQSKDYVIRKFEQASPQKVGMKAWNLLLLRDKFSIPEFAIISVDAYNSYYKSKTISSQIEKQIKGVLEEFLKNGAVAVRSSGTAEDLCDASFAGMYKTFLGINSIEDGIRAVKDVWKSATSERIQSYCKEVNIKNGPMAVIIQKQLNPEVSGVMITQSPYAINELLIECCSGLGEKLVSGHITPSRYRIKEEKIIEQKGEDLLTPDQIIRIIQTGKDIERVFNSPQEIEWAIENKRLYVLQARPITSHKIEPRRRCTVWCNVNVRETIPDPVSPLMWSFFEEFLFPMIIIDVFGFPISRAKFRRYPPVENLSGRLYWNINNTIAYGKVVGPLLDLLGSEKNLDPQMALAFKSIDVKSIPATLNPIHSAIFSIISFARLTNFIIKSYFCPRRFSEIINTTNIEFEEKINSITIYSDLQQGLANIEDWIALENFARRYFSGIFLSIFYLIILEKILGWRMGTKSRIIARKLVFGLLDKTGLMVKNIDGLAELAKKKLKNISIEVLKNLYQSDHEFKDAFDLFLKEYGHRGPGEFDIASKTYSEEPEIVMHLLVAPRMDCSDFNGREKIIKQIISGLRPFERTIVKSFLPRLESYIPLRENGKHYYFKQMAKLKEQLFVIADKLIDKNFIKEKRDIFFITWDELKSIANGKLNNSKVFKIVEMRKQEWQLFKEAPVPDIVYESGEKMSNQMQKGKIIYGEPLSFGMVRARVRIIRELKEGGQLKEGEILVTHHTDPGWTPLFSITSGVIIEVGGFICHAAMVARELGIPGVVIKGATSLIKDGQEIELDANSGRVEIIN
ncbi:MAG: PEP/pyruvate-binding domain-containing protein [bacterium]